ncbi:hypothetical protein B0A49_08524 [Cryomyces minteri]|uniref:DUF218 domain-containing protein n=1 Tax=Cryomyces minteri TaxID=331657 RepID=A0A4U0WUL6_9PEZI|nr:hypothetical protein B0A49_08524 [Cryomyces minteri]
MSTSSPSSSTYSSPSSSAPPKTDLIVLCCHAIYARGPNSSVLNNPHDESQWHLQPFQRGEHETFMQHIAASFAYITTSTAHERTVLVISGGATRRGEGVGISEARSYLHAYCDGQTQTRVGAAGVNVDAETLLSEGQVLLEEYATDSLQNLLFSIVRFRRAVGTWPRMITVVTHAFKAERFLDLHAPAIHWPPDRIRASHFLRSTLQTLPSKHLPSSSSSIVILVSYPAHPALINNSPSNPGTSLASTLLAESTNAILPFAANPYASGPILAGKRVARGWRLVHLGGIVFAGLGDAVWRLLRWQGPERFGERLPWEEEGDWA